VLSEFSVPILLGEERTVASLLVQDVEACVFWQGYPDTHAEAATPRDLRQAEAAWLQHLLARVTVTPMLTLDWVREMADDSWPPTQAYLEAVGFFPRPVLAPTEATALREIPGLPVRTARSARQRAAEFAAFRGCVPPVHVQRLLRLLAPAVGIPASQLWLMPASEFFFNYHVQLSDEQKTIAPLPEVSHA
jgi:hypothetical protein